MAHSKGWSGSVVNHTNHGIFRPSAVTRSNAPANPNDLIKDCFKDGDKVRVDLNVDGHAPVTFDGRFLSDAKVGDRFCAFGSQAFVRSQKESYARRGTRIKRSFGEKKSKRKFCDEQV